MSPINCDSGGTDKTLRNMETWHYISSGNVHTAIVESPEVDGSPLRFCFLLLLFPFLFALPILFPFSLYFLFLPFLSFLSLLFLSFLSVPSLSFLSPLVLSFPFLLSLSFLSPLFASVLLYPYVFVSPLSAFWFFLLAL